MDIPKETGVDKAITGLKIGVNLIPFVGGSLAEAFDAIVIPPIQKRRKEWMQMVVEKLKELHEANKDKLEEILNDEGFQSLLISSSIHAFKTHQIEKKEHLRNGLLNSIESENSYELNQQFINFIDVLSLLHINVLNHIHLCQSELNKINKISLYYDACKSGTLGGHVCSGISELEISVFRFLLKDLESKGLVMLSSDLTDLENKVFESTSLTTDDVETVELPFIQITQFGIDFINFIKIKE
tara:strand:- start:809 stop:1534 length:726 start_codon:yes stop_codon:yes gene_type:complete